ncbi:hypothetical protein [Marimonas arenosa]|uniref:Uncharacterized protein n=1 Tax=Marimonas arenosa TaxID=1795305 RepID=A0AAE4B3K1_9RHOB|nr:hypothetical protein [Marimonas arenosa]MDQ2088459.1 hypothetical protein [Marimonas arenosa]
MKTWTTILPALVLSLAIGPAQAQDKLEGERPAQAVEALVKQLDEILPRWDESILQQPETADWTADLTLTTVIRSLGARDLAEVAQKAPNGASFLQTKAEALRVDPARGYVRYANRAAAVDLSRKVPPLPEPPEVMERGIEILSRLGLPPGEFAKPQVETQMAAGGSIKAEKPERVDEVYRLLVVGRVINDLPVFGSNALVAMTSKAELQRLRTQWPVFRMEHSDKLLEREVVLLQSAEVLLDHGIAAGDDLRAQLGYAPVADEPGSAYVPVALIAGAVEPTPVMISVPLVSPGDFDER